MSRPEWIDYFLGLAFVVSLRSQDSQTKHGCVITNKDNRILGVGYNGFPRKCKDESRLPTTRPSKYSWMLHSERNALANCIIRPEGGIAYVTGQCCNDCLMAMWQEGVEDVVMADKHGSHLIDENAKQVREEFVMQTGMRLTLVQPQLDWLKNACNSL